VIEIALLLGIAVVCGILLVRQGEQWGTTPEERAQFIPGDEYLEGGARARVAMTRAVSIRAAPGKVWPWVAQLGRGAGWYSIDRLDNANRTSAKHIVSWIPEPQMGDATAIGYLRHIDRGRSLAWWADGARFIGARTRLVTSYVLEQDGSETRLVSRMSADATGISADLAICVFRVVDSVMATRQLIGIRDRVESCEATPPLPPIDPESGARDQFQVYEVIYAGGEAAGILGKEDGARWRCAAIEDGVLGE
jgi:hypothetical protein